MEGLQGKNVVLLGRMKTMSSSVMRAHITRLGGMVRKTPRSTTHVFIMSDAGGDKIERALARYGARATFLTEAEFAQLTQALEERDTQPLGDALGELRALFDQPPSPEVWQSVTERLDACAPEHLEAAVHHVGAHIAPWPTPADEPDAPIPLEEHRRLRFAPPSWMVRMLEGERSLAFGLVGGMRFGWHAINGAMGIKLIEHPDLLNLVELDVGNNKLSKTFYRKLSESPMTLKLTTLTLGAIDLPRAQALCREGALPALRFVRLSGHKMSLPGPLGSRELFEAPWWETVEGLDMENPGAYAGDRDDDFLRAFVDRPMPALRHLRLSLEDASVVLGHERALASVERLGFRHLTSRVSAQLADRLREPHAIKTLDLRPLRARRPRRAHVAGPLLQALMEPVVLGRLQQLILPSSLLEDEEWEALCAVAKGVDVTVRGGI